MAPGTIIEWCCRDLAAGYHVRRWPAELTNLTSRKAGPMIREELTSLFTWEERHRRLAARLLIALGLTLLVLAVGSVLIWVFESGVKGGDIHGYGDAVTCRRADCERSAALRTLCGMSGCPAGKNRKLMV
jgi:hypothetical protein